MLTRRTGIFATLAAAAATLLGCAPARTNDIRGMSDAELLQHCGADAQRWAEAFCAIARSKGHELDEGWMIAWFANAIEHGHAVKMAKPLREIAEGARAERYDVASEYQRGYVNGIRVSESIFTGREPDFI